VASGLAFLGGMSSAIVEQQVPTSFDKGMNRFTWLMIYFILVMVPLVFVINGLTKGGLERSLLLRPAGGGGVDAGDVAHDSGGLPFPRARSPCPARR
jgi:hypothetical protein